MSFLSLAIYIPNATVLLVIDSRNNDVTNFQTVSYESYESFASQGGFDGFSIGGYGKLDYLSLILNLRINDFLNIETHEVNFDSEEFVSLLEWINNNVIDSNEFGGALGEGVFAECIEVNNIVNLLYISSETTFENINLIGLPTEYENIVGIIPQYTFAINSDCAAPEIAREFINIGYTERYQQVLALSSIPSNPEYINTAFVNNQEEVVRMFYQMIEEADSVYYYNQSITDVVLEDAASYFAGDRTSRDVAELIQNRATLIMQERYS